MPSAAALERRPRQTANSPQGHQTALNAPSQSSSISEPSRRKRPVNNLGDWDHDNDEMLTSGLPNSRRKRRRSGPPKAGDTCDGALASQMTLACPSEIDCCSDSACDLSIISHEPHSNSCSLILCLNPDECDQEDCCTDEACNHPCEFDLRQSYPSSKENDLTNTCHGNLVDFHNFDSLESNESIPCQWLETDHQCSAFGPPAALSQHVFKDHIEQNTLLPCGWAQCDQTVDSQQLLQHVAKAHQPDQYVCLWQGCGCSFSSDEELAAHMSAMHCTKLDCHWGGCELFGLDPVALKSHVFDDHINFHPSDTFNPLPYSGEFFTSSSAPSLQNNTRPSSSSSTSNLASQHSHAQLSLPQVEPMVNDSEKHSCFWTLETMTNSICAASFANENDLQAHIEKDHLSDLSSRTSPLGTAVFVCKWRGCKSKGTPHNGKDKLRKHTYTHTGCYFYECEVCSHKFSLKGPYENHLRVHTGEKPFKCEKCESAFPSKESLTNHMRTHTGEKHLKCEMCDFQCGDSSNMSKHRKTHKPPVNYCPICQKGFCRPDSLKRHMIQHKKTSQHKGASADVSED